MGSVHVCQSRLCEVRIITADCPTCEQPRDMVGRFYAWYGWTQTCLGCGDAWQDGEMCPRPFMPRWRQQSIKKALEFLPLVGKVQEASDG